MDQPTSDLFSLDLLQSWDIDEAPWTIVQPVSDTAPLVAYAASAALPGRSWFLINGGETGRQHQTMLYDTQRKQWIIPALSGLHEIQRLFIALFVSWVKFIH